MNEKHSLKSTQVKVALVAILVVLATVAGISMLRARDSVPLPQGGSQTENNNEVLGGLRPHRIVIPTIGVSASVVPVGVDGDGNMAVPEDLQTAGWYEPGFKPGQAGSAVFAGHVNSRFGLPTIFESLEKIEIGDTFSILAETGDALTFEVVAKNTYDFRYAPLEEIYGPHDVPTVNLITCVDELWLGALETYKDRLVVTAELISAEGEK